MGTAFEGSGDRCHLDVEVGGHRHRVDVDGHAGGFGVATHACDQPAGPPQEISCVVYRIVDEELDPDRVDDLTLDLQHEVNEPGDRGP